MAIGLSRELHFKDMRPPHEVRFMLERSMRTLFTSTIENDQLCMRANATLVGAEYRFCLRFEAAFETCNFYSLSMDVSWAEQSSSHSEYYCQNSGSWFEVWTRDFRAAKPPLASEGSSQRYHQLCEEALNAEQHLDTIAAIQRAIIAAMKSGASFRTSHKEGGTKIYWKSDRFIRSDYGDYPDEQQFVDEANFFNMLRKFCHSDVTRNSGQYPLSEIDTWRLIMRRLDIN